MRTLVCWDDPKQAELIALYLNNDENSAVIYPTQTERAELVRRVQEDGPWDAALLAVNPENFESAFETFTELKRMLPDVPFVGACQTQDVFRIARFMTHGMRTYLIRDEADDFVFMLQSTLESVVEAVRAERERMIAERLRQEVESVRKLQESIIPHDVRSPAGYQVCARYESSQIQVLGGQPVVLAGGDYYDAFMMDESSMVVLLGDASGHGMKACMSIMTMHTLIRMMRNEGYRDTAEFVTEVNHRLCEQQIVQEEGGFITLLFGILNAESHEIQWTSAGHPPPLMHNLSENTVSPLGTPDDGGLPLGIYADAEYSINTSPVPPHSRLLLYTDGLEEAFPARDTIHTEFGRRGVMRVLKKCRQLPLEQTLDALFEESQAFTGGSGRHDDTSVLLLERQELLP